MHLSQDCEKNKNRKMEKELLQKWNILLLQQLLFLRPFLFAEWFQVIFL